MGCPSEVELGQNLVFSICTHDPDTGILTDAASVPAYRLYEAETATPILNGDMAKLDDANTTGFYTELIECTVGNGFEVGLSYTIYISATVAGNEGGIAYGFRVTPSTIAAIKAKTDQLLFTGDGYVKSDQQYPTGAVVADAGNGALAFMTDLVDTISDTHKGKYLKFTSGTLINQVKKVSAYNGSTKVITVSSAFTGTPAGSDAYEIIDQ